MQWAWTFGVGLITFLWLASTDADTATAFLFGVGAACITAFVYVGIAADRKKSDDQAASGLEKKDS